MIIDGIYQTPQGYNLWTDTDDEGRRRINATSPHVGYSHCYVPTGMWNYEGFVSLGIITSTSLVNYIAINVNEVDCHKQGTFFLLDISDFVQLFGFIPLMRRPNELQSSIKVVGGYNDIRYIGRKHYAGSAGLPGKVRIRTHLTDIQK